MPYAPRSELGKLFIKKSREIAREGCTIPWFYLEDYIIQEIKDDMKTDRTIKEAEREISKLLKQIKKKV